MITVSYNAYCAIPKEGDNDIWTVRPQGVVPLLPLCSQIDVGATVNALPGDTFSRENNTHGSQFHDRDPQFAWRILGAMTQSCYIGTRDIRSRVIRGPYCIWIFKVVCDLDHLLTKVRCKDLPDSDRGDFRCRRAVDSSSYYWYKLHCMKKNVHAFSVPEFCIFEYPGPVFCLLRTVNSDYAQSITVQVTEVTCPVICRAQPELTLSNRQNNGPWCLRQKNQGATEITFHQLPCQCERNIVKHQQNHFFFKIMVKHWNSHEIDDGFNLVCSQGVWEHQFHDTKYSIHMISPSKHRT